MQRRKRETGAEAERGKEDREQNEGDRGVRDRGIIRTQEQNKHKHKDSHAET